MLIQLQFGVLADNVQMNHNDVLQMRWKQVYTTWLTYKKITAAITDLEGIKNNDVNTAIWMGSSGYGSAKRYAGYYTANTGFAGTTSTDFSNASRSSFVIKAS